MYQSATLTCQLISPSIKHLLSSALINSWQFMRSDKIWDIWRKWKEINRKDVGLCTHTDGEARTCQQQRICGWFIEGWWMACVWV